MAVLSSGGAELSALLACLNGWSADILDRGHSGIESLLYWVDLTL